MGTAPRAYESGAAGFALGSETNVFTGADRAAAELARDNYATANPAWLAEYDADKSLNIRLEFADNGNDLVVFQVRNTLSAWSDNQSFLAVKGDPGPGAQDALDALHGIYDSGVGTLITINADPTKYDVSAFDYYIEGVKYSFPGEAGRPSGFVNGNDFMIVNVDATGIVELPKDTFNTPTSLDSALELGGLGTDDGTSISFVGQSHFDQDTMSKDLYRWSKFSKGTDYVGVAGSVSENLTPLRIDIAGGSINSPDLKDLEIAAGTAIAAKPYHHVSGDWDFQPTVSPLIVSNSQYDNGTDLATVSNNKWLSHTLIRSARTGTIYYVPSQGEYASEAEAIDAPPSLGGFEGQVGTDVSPLAKLVIQQGSASINVIIDVRNQTSNVISASTSTLQTTYERSLPTAEIVTNGTNGAHTVREGTGDDTGRVYEGKDNAGNVKYSVQGDGETRIGTDAPLPNTTSDHKVQVEGYVAHKLGWSDMIVTFAQGGFGPNAPTWTTDSDGFAVLSFGTNDEVTTYHHVNHNYAITTDAFPHIHFAPEGVMAEGETAVWELKYKIAKGHDQNDSVLGNVVTVTLTYTAGAGRVAGNHIVLEVDNADAFDLIEADTLVMLKFRRLAGTYSGALYGYFADIHHQSDREVTIGKRPDFNVAD